MNKRTLWTAVLLLAISLVLVVGANAGAIRERIAIWTSDDSFICDGADIDFYSDNLGTQTAEIEGAAGSAQFDAFVDVGTFLMLQSQSQITVTDNCTVTMTGSWQPIASAANIGITNIVPVKTDVLIGLQNKGSYTVTITETNGIIDNGGNAVLPPGGVWLGYYDGTKIRGLVDKDD